jgi:hypothetical protein
MGFGRPSAVAMAQSGAVALPASLVDFIIQVSSWHQLLLALVTTLLFLLTIAPLELQRRIINEALGGSSFQPVLLLSLAYAGLALIEGLIKLLTNIYRAWISESIVRLLREVVQRHLKDMPDRTNIVRADGVRSR